MRLHFDREESQILAQVIQSALEARARLAATAAPPDRARIETESRLLEGLRRRLAEAHREEVLDESVEETFPASDPPAHSVPGESR